MVAKVVRAKVSSKRATTMKPPKPSKVKVWDNEKILKLINLVKSEESLWNSNDIGHGKKHTRNNAWSRVVDSFDGHFDESEVRRKWTNVKAAYNQSLRNKTGWLYVKPLSFLASSKAQPVTASPQRSVTPPSKYSQDEADDSVEEGGTTISTDANLPHSSAAVSPDKTVPNCSAVSITTTPTSAAPRQQGISGVGRDEALVTFMLSELRTLSVSDANILRCRLQRTLLEFSEENHNNMSMSMNAADLVEMNYSIPKNY